MNEKMIKNIEHAKPAELKGLIEYDKGKVVSLTLTRQPGVGLTLFAFDEGEQIGTHAAGGDAMVQILEGEAEITVDGVPHIVKAGEMIVMPEQIPHGLRAVTPFKMLLTVVFRQ